MVLRSRIAGAAIASLALFGCGDDDGGAADAGPPIDGTPAPDAVELDADVANCEADHRESRDRTNDPFDDDGTAESTGLMLTPGGEPFTVCGEIDPASAGPVIADSDAYSFEVTGNNAANVRIELVAPGAAELASLSLGLYQAGEGPPVQLADVAFKNGYAMIAGLALDPGDYWIGAAAGAPAPADPVVYSIQVAHNTFSCAAAAGAPTDTEGGDGPGDRGNDVVAIDYSAESPTLTASVADAPEATGITLEPDVIAHIRGESADIASDGDDYLDRDAYLVTTGATTTELEVRLTWPDPAGEDAVDLDVYLFAAGDPTIDYSERFGAVAGDAADETFTINVDPDTTYWLWTGAFDDSAQGGATLLPVTYDLTLCPRAH